MPIIKTDSCGSGSGGGGSSSSAILAHLSAFLIFRAGSAVKIDDNEHSGSHQFMRWGDGV